MNLAIPKSKLSREEALRLLCGQGEYMTKTETYDDAHRAYVKLSLHEDPEIQSIAKEMEKFFSIYTPHYLYPSVEEMLAEVKAVG